MKKWVFGCLGLFIIVAAAGGYGVYRFVYLPGKAYVQSFTQLKVVPELNAKVVNKAPFTPPADNTLTAGSIDRFMQTQQTIQTRLGERLRQLEAKYEAIEQRQRAGGGEPTLGEAIDALKDLTSLFLEAKEAQVDALNAANLSLAEYEWTRGRIYEALGLPIDTTLQTIISDISAGRAPDLDNIQNPPEVVVPEKNRELVERYREQLTNNAALAFFAL